ncbi:MAG: helix-turn-helix domain-containing protein, partial [Bryobacteraceae bacterium]
KEDIPFLASHFVRKLAPSLGAKAQSISAEAVERLMSYHWPGNVRELENVIERSLVLSAGERLEAADIRLETEARGRMAEGLFSLPEGMTLDQFEQAILREALRKANGNKSQAARLLGLSRNALRYRLAQMGMDSAG